jgi:sugar/nucleoside kinase (ribokinase family)
MNKLSPEILFAGYLVNDINIFPKKRSENPGGAVFFSAIAALTLTKSIGISSKVGKDYKYIKLLDDLKVDTKGIKKSKKNTTNVKIRYTDSNDLSKRSLEISDGASSDFSPEDIPIDWLISAKYIHIATMDPFQQLMFVKFIKNLNLQCKISIDSDSHFMNKKENIVLIKDMLGYVDTVFLNRYEYEILNRFIYTVPQVLVKKDSEGASLLKFGLKKHTVEADKVEAVDATGAGDVFAGAFLAAQLVGLDSSLSLEYAVRLATKSVTENGVGHIIG